MYEIMYFERQTPTSVYDTNTTLKKLDIEGLDPDSDYMFQIKGYTSKGAGPWSRKLPFHTYGQCKWFFVYFVLYSCISNLWSSTSEEYVLLKMELTNDFFSK